MKSYPQLKTSKNIDLKELSKKDNKHFDPFYGSTKSSVKEDTTPILSNPFMEAE